MPYIETSQGRLHLAHNGVATHGPNLILIHGAGGEVRCWPATWRLAADAATSVGLAITADRARLTNHSIYAIDLPGHGRSGGAPLSTIAELASLIEEVLEAQNITNAVPVGHSMGGAIALALAARANPRIVGQVIVASAARIGVTDEILTGLLTDFEKTVDFIVKYSFDRSAAPFFPLKARAYALAAGAAANHADFRACSTFDMRAGLTAITLPTLVIAAENDRMIPLKHTASLADALPNARLETIPAAGHYPHLERTRSVERLIADFCSGL